MDRFLSKLDLRDIKIKPEGNQFLPTDDDVELEEDTAVHDAVEEIDDVKPDFAQQLDVSLTSVADSPLHVSESNHVATAPATYDEPANEETDNEKTNSEVLKVSAKSRPSAVAGAIAGVVRENGRAEVQAIGAGATNQAVKAVAIARDYLWESEIDAVCVPEFIDVIIDNEERTAIRLVVETR